MEYAVGHLADLIAGGCTPLTTLWAVTKRDGTVYPVIVSQTIKGPMMQSVLMQNVAPPAKATGIKFNPKSFSFAVIVALLTNPEGSYLSYNVVTFIF